MPTVYVCVFGKCNDARYCYCFVCISIAVVYAIPPPLCYSLFGSQFSTVTSSKDTRPLSSSDGMEWFLLFLFIAIERYQTCLDGILNIVSIQSFIFELLLHVTKIVRLILTNEPQTHVQRAASTTSNRHCRHFRCIIFESM